MKIKEKPQCLINIIGVIYSALCILPFLLVISASLTNEHALSENGYKLIFDDAQHPLRAGLNRLRVYI